MRWRKLGHAAALAAVAASTIVASTLAPAAHASDLNGVVDCLGPAPNPAPGTTAWTVRDLDNQICASQRIVNELTSPAFADQFASQTAQLFPTQTLAQLATPAHLHLTLGQFVPGGDTADPFRTIANWTGSGRGRVTPVSFAATDGATLNGNLFEPPARIAGPYPGVVITDGSLQGFQQMYYWAAEGLAEAGYMVMTYDVQGQGDSDTLPATCSVSSCPGVPFQQSYNFFQGAEDALNFVLSTPSIPYKTRYSSPTLNPLWKTINAAQIGVAGHSLGASAVSQLAQCDKRVKAVAAWDNLAPATGASASSITIPAADTYTKPSLKTPAIGINSEYFLNPEPMSSPPNPHGNDQAYRQLVKAGTDTMQVALRDSTHLEYAYIPYILPASELGERVAFYYTLAWFDRYVRGIPDAYQRLVATKFDRSSDIHSIGAGPPQGAQNTPPLIGGLPVANRVSFYDESEYAITAPGATAKDICLDMRAGCPKTAPATP